MIKFNKCIVYFIDAVVLFLISIGIWTIGFYVHENVHLLQIDSDEVIHYCYLGNRVNYQNETMIGWVESKAGSGKNINESLAYGLQVIVMFLLVIVVAEFWLHNVDK